MYPTIITLIRILSNEKETPLCGAPVFVLYYLTIFLAVILNLNTLTPA